MKPVLSAFAAGLAMCFLAFPVLAGTDDIRASDRAIELDVGASNLRYGENIDNVTFDTENGWMPDIGAGVTWLTSNGGGITSNLYLHIDEQATLGDTHYNGGVQVVSGGTVTTFPYQTTTKNTIYHTVGKVGRLFTLGEGITLTPYGDLGWRWWRRKIKGGPFNAGGLGTLTIGDTTEVYQNWEGGGGLLLQVSPVPRLVLSASGQIGTTFEGLMQSGGFTYDLGSKPVWQVAGKAGYAITQSFELTADARFDGFGIGKSPFVNRGNGIISNEPDSYTHQLTIMGGIAYHL